MYLMRVLEQHVITIVQTLDAVDQILENAPHIALRQGQLLSELPGTEPLCLDHQMLTNRLRVIASNKPGDNTVTTAAVHTQD